MCTSIAYSSRFIAKAPSFILLGKLSLEKTPLKDSVRNFFKIGNLLLLRYYLVKELFIIKLYSTAALFSKIAYYLNRISRALKLKLIVKKDMSF